VNTEQWLINHYGSRRGFVRTVWHRFLYLLGRYRNYTQIDLQPVKRLVFVCKGNICRSAYAEAVANSLGIEAISCGLDAIEDAPANDVAIDTARKLGFDLAPHTSRPIMYLILKKTDLLVAMEPQQAEYLQKNLRRNHACTLLGLWSQPALPHIQDPYGSSPEYFKKCFTYIQTSVNELASKIEKKPAG
jgi:protein-tyrosine phosphatase